MSTETKCSVDGCEKPAFSKGYCRRHYKQIWRWGKILPEKEERQKVTEAKCSVAGCEKRMHAKGYCRKHYGQIWRTGEIYADEDRQMTEEEVAPRNDADRVRALARELERAEEMYRNVVGVEGRLKWRRECEELKKDMVRLGIAPPGPATVETAS